MSKPRSSGGSRPGHARSTAEQSRHGKVVLTVDDEIKSIDRAARLKKAQLCCCPPFCAPRGGERESGGGQRPRSPLGGGKRLREPRAR